MEKILVCNKPREQRTLGDVSLFFCFDVPAGPLVTVDTTSPPTERSPRVGTSGARRSREGTPNRIERNNSTVQKPIPKRVAVTMLDDGDNIEHRRDGRHVGFFRTVGRRVRTSKVQKRGERFGLTRQRRNGK